MIIWHLIFSDPFPVLRGVRQGGILSPYFFAMYIDELSKQLTNCGFGLTLMGEIINHLIYADDICLLATSKSALESLLKICDDYASEHGLTFNSQKTQLQVFFPKWVNSLNPVISIMFKGSEIGICSSVRYLGYIIQSDTKWNKDSLSDEDEIVKRSGDLYKRAYMIRSKFSKCSLSMKKYLFTTYLSSIYCSSLWMLSRPQYQKIRVSYNNALRIVFGLSRDSSASSMFIDYNIKTFL